MAVKMMKTPMESPVRPMVRTNKKVFLHTHTHTHARMCAYDHIFNLCNSLPQDAAEIKVIREFRKQWYKFMEGESIEHHRMQRYHLWLSEHLHWDWQSIIEKHLYVLGL